VYGESKSTEGAGVYGNASADSGESYGLYGEAQSTSGTGVLGYALSATGTTVGVAGKTGSSAGVAGLFDNLAGGSILLGQTNGTERFRVGGNGNVTASGNVTATSFVGPLTGAASDLNCTGCVAEAELGFSTATQAELDAEATLRATADATLQTGINNRVLKAGDTMTGTLNLPVNGLKVGTSQLWAYNGNVGIGSAGMQDRSLFVWRTGVEDSASNYGLYVGNATTQATGSVSKYGALIAITGAVRGDNYGLDVKNDSTNTVTDGASKYGVRIISDTNFPGGAGTATRNWGLYVQSPMGADQNYAAYFGGNVGIGTDTPAQALAVVGNGSFSGSVTASSFVGALTGAASDVSCAGCVNASDLAADAATQSELDAEATARAAADTTLQTDVNSRVLKAGDTMNGTLNLPANGLVLGTTQLVASSGGVGIGANGAPDKQLRVRRTGTEDTANYGIYVANETSQTAGSGSKFGGYVSNSGAVQTTSYGLFATNSATNTTTDGVLKYGLAVNSYGTFTGSGGTATRNYALHVSPPDGADENYGAYIGGKVGIGTETPGRELEVNGGVRLNTTTLKPACDSATRGTFWVTLGGAGVEDLVEVCTKDAADAYAWRNVI